MIASRFPVRLLQKHIHGSCRLASSAWQAQSSEIEGVSASWTERSRARDPHVGIIGCGGVGTATASSIIHKGRSCARHISIYDKDADRCEGEVMDLSDQASFQGVDVHHAPRLQDLSECDVIVIASGAKCKPGETRIALSYRNAAMLRTLLSSMVQLRVVTPRTILILASNPVDALTAVSSRWLATCGVAPGQIIGTGTYVDSQRLRVLIAKQLAVPPESVHAYVLGEHGDSQVASYDMTTVDSSALLQHGMDRKLFESLAVDTRRRAQEIVYRKGHTRHCVGECVAQLCHTITQDLKNVVPVSTFVSRFNCVFGWPAVVGRTGVERILPVHLTASEESALELSAAQINNVVNSILDTEGRTGSSTTKKAVIACSKHSTAYPSPTTIEVDIDSQ